MECETCQGRGFIEHEHGLFRTFCGCTKGKALEVEVTGKSGIVPPPKDAIPHGDEQVIPLNEMPSSLPIEIPVVGVKDDSDSGTEPDNQPIGSPKYLIIPEPISGKTIDETVAIAREIIEANNDSSIRTRRDNSNTGSPDTGKPKKPKKSKTKKKSRKSIS